MRNIARRISLAPITIVALLLPAAARAQDPAEGIDKIVGWAKPSTPGCVIAVSQNGKVVFNRAYGSADLEREAPLTTDSVFDIGSMMKQFVAAATLLLVQDGRIALTDDIRKYLPELPDYGHKVTINHLLTHTSGIRDWTALVPLAGGGIDALTLILRQRGLNFAPGEEISYSSSGFILLTEIVSRESDMPFAQFLKTRVFEPLGMKSSSYRSDMRDVVKNRALAYSKEDGAWKYAVRMDNNRGAGGILSTAGDLLLWNEALTNKRLGAFVTEKMQEKTKLNNGRTLDYGRALIVSSFRDMPVIFHSGAAGGYSCWAGRLPSQGLAIAVLSNQDDIAASSIASRVAEVYLKAAGVNADEIPAPPAADPGVEVDLKGKDGLFFSEIGNEPLRMVVSGGRLRVAGAPPLVASGKDLFRNPRGMWQFRSQDEFELRYLSADEVELKTMEGKVTVYRRAKPFSPTEAELKAFEGRYENREIGTVFRIEAKGSGALVHHESSNGKASAVPVAPDTLSSGNSYLRFLRDSTGKVVALEYTSPILRKVVFSRMPDR